MKLLLYYILERQKAYPISQFLSDIGGSVGLGLTLASMVTYCQTLLKIVLKLLKAIKSNEKTPKPFKKSREADSTEITSLSDQIHDD